MSADHTARCLAETSAPAEHEESCCLSGHPNSPAHRLPEPCITRCTCPPVHAAPGTGNTEPAEVCEHHWVVDADQMDPTGAYCSRCMVSRNQIGYVIGAAAPRTEPPAEDCERTRGVIVAGQCPHCLQPWDVHRSGPVTAQVEPTAETFQNVTDTAALRNRARAMTAQEDVGLKHVLTWAADEIESLRAAARGEGA